MTNNTKPKPHRDPQSELPPKTVRHYQNHPEQDAPLYQDIQAAETALAGTEPKPNSPADVGFVKPEQQSNTKIALPAQKSEDPLDINGASQRLGYAILRYSVDKDSGKISTPFGLKDGVDFAWLAMNFARKWEPPYDPRATVQEKAYCFSRNGVVPHGGTAPLPGPCEQCPKAAWNGKEKPECAEIYKLLCFDLDNFVPFVVVVKRTGIKSLQLYKTLMEGLSRKNTRPYRANLCHATQLKGIKEKTWYIPAFSIQAAIDDKVAQYLQGITKRLVASLASQDIEDDQDAPEPGSQG